MREEKYEETKDIYGGVLNEIAKTLQEMSPDITHEEAYDTASETNPNITGREPAEPGRKESSTTAIKKIPQEGSETFPGMSHTSTTGDSQEAAQEPAAGPVSGAVPGPAPGTEVVGTFPNSEASPPNSDELNGASEEGMSACVPKHTG